jgi:hypothetical protein
MKYRNVTLIRCGEKALEHILNASCLLIENVKRGERKRCVWHQCSVGMSSKRVYDEPHVHDCRLFHRVGQFNAQNFFN